MARCEDFPCCGHDHGCCPVDGKPVCVECKKVLPKGSRSSICEPCYQWMLRQEEMHRGHYYERD